MVDAIGNEEDVASVDLTHILPSATIMVVSVTAATTTWAPLTDAELAHVYDACKLMVKVDEDKKEVLAFLESQMHRIAPNLSRALGAEIAAKLMGLAGGLIELSNMPSCNIQVRVEWGWVVQAQTFLMVFEGDVFQVQLPCDAFQLFAW